MRTFKPHLEILSEGQGRLWPRLMETPRWFTLYGGTALALRLGHRASVDFDFFSSESFSEEELRREIPYARNAQVLQRDKNTLALRLSDFKETNVSFFGGLTLGRAADPEFDTDRTILIASLLDIAAMKIVTITKRAMLRDYLDLAAVLRHAVGLPTALAVAKAIYRQEFDPMLGLKALAYFGDLPDLPKEIGRFLAETAAAVTEIPSVELVDDSITPREYRKSDRLR